MSFSLSVRQKLIAIVALVCVGYAAFGAYSIFELNKMSQTSGEASSLSRLTNHVKNLEIDLLKIERQIALLNPASVKQVHSDIATIKTRLEDNNSLKALNNQGKQHLKTTFQLLPDYLSAMDNYVETKSKLGLASNLGALGELNKNAQAVAEKMGPLEAFSSKFKEVRNKEKDFLAYPDDQHEKALASALTALKSNVENMGFGDVFNPLIDQYEKALKPVEQLSFSVEKQKSLLNTLSQNNLQSMDESTQYLQNTLLAGAEEVSKNTAKEARKSVIIGCIILALVIGFILATVIRSLNRNLASVLSLLNEIAQGKLSTRKLDQTSDQNDEFKQLLQASNTMSEGLRSLLQHLLQSNQHLNETAEELDRSVKTITSGSERIRDRSNTLASSTEEISATAETVKNRTESVQHLTQTTYQSAQQGVSVIQAAMASISNVADTIQSTNERVDRLGESSKEIDLVIDLIVDVANQTSLLALNAAIEAARAGEAGRGFAVVADEVKALADQTVKASGNITSKVEGIQRETLAVIEAMSLSLEKVSESKTLGQNAVQTIHQVEQHSQEAMSNTDEISQSIKEVAMTTAQMAQDMDQIAQDISENYQATQAINLASKQVHQQCRELRQQINRFDLS